MLQYGWALKTLRKVKEARHKRTTTVWFHVHEISRIKQIPRDGKEIRDFQGIIRGENRKLLLNKYRLPV